MTGAAHDGPAGGPGILLCGWAGAGNIGDELLARAMIDRLVAEGASPVVTSRDPAGTERCHPGVRAVPWGPAGLRHLEGIAGVIVGPGGILQDSSSLWSLVGHLAVPAVLGKRGLPIAAVGVGAEPLTRRSSGPLLRRVLGDAPVITRDEASSDALRGVGLCPTTAVDVVFGLPLPTVAAASEIVVSVGPTVRPGNLAPASRRLSPAPAVDIASVLDQVAAELACRVVLTCFRGDRDATVAAEIGARLTSDHEILGDDIDEHVARVAGARLVISSRYHPIVLAAVAGVPVAAVSDQPKVRSLVTTVGATRARRFASWDEIAASKPIPQPTEPWRPDELVIAHDAVRQLVERALG